jgi:hypothetical protein
MKIRTATLLVVLVSVVICAEAAYLVIHKAHEAKPQNAAEDLSPLWTGNYEAERLQWKESIDRLGVPKAYELFKKDGEGKPFGVQHTFAHIFGRLIYDKEGIAGIADCDSTFSFGCYHSLAGRAILEEGLPAVKELDRACFQALGAADLGCLHGIGHGILGTVGYDHMDEALQACLDTSWKGSYGGCPGGVFMEYNFHTMESVVAAKSRLFDREHPYAPCDAVDKRFSQECYYYQALWWSRTFAGSLSHDFASIGELCLALPSDIERAACLRGMGEAASSRTEFAPEKTVELCDALPDPRSRLLCREGAWRVYFAGPQTRNDAPLICAGLSPADAKLCDTEFVIEEDLARSEVR